MTIAPITMGVGAEVTEDILVTEPQMGSRKEEDEESIDAGTVAGACVTNLVSVILILLFD